MSLPEYRIPRLSASKAVADITPADFALSPAVKLVDTMDGAAPAQATDVRLAYDAASLYAFFDCEEKLPLCTYTQHDASLYMQNVCELFIDPLGLGKLYFELQVNPLNARFDALILNDFGTNGIRRGKRFQGLRDWNPASFVSRSETGNGRWRVFLKIDFADLFVAPHCPPQAGDAWRANILRVDWDGSDQKFYSWSVNGVLDFHRTEKFGIWRFE